MYFYDCYNKNNHGAEAGVVPSLSEAQRSGKQWPNYKIKILL